MTNAGHNLAGFHKLRYFMAVAEAGSISKASSRLGISQPSLSKQIQLIEEEYRCRLFYRDGRGVELTSAGQKLFVSLMPIAAELERVRAELINASDKLVGTVRFGIPPSIGATIVAPMALRFRELAPDVHLHVVEAFSGTLLEWVEDGSVDVGILYDNRRSKSMTVQTVLDEELYLIDHPKRSSDRPFASVKDIRTQELVLPGGGHGLRRAVEDMSRELGLKIEPKLEIDSVPALKQLVEFNAAQTILPYGGVHREVAEGRLIARRIENGLLRARLVLTTALHRPVTNATQILIDVVKEEIDRCVKEGILRVN